MKLDENELQRICMLTTKLNNICAGWNAQGSLSDDDVEWVLSVAKETLDKYSVVLARPRVTISNCPICETLITYTELAIEEEHWVGCPHECRNGQVVSPHLGSLPQAH